MKQTAKINKRWFLEKINKTDKPLARIIKKKRETTEISKIRNEKGEITANNAEIQRITRDYYKQIYGNRQPERNRRILRKILFKTESGRIKKYEEEKLPVIKFNQ